MPPYHYYFILITTISFIPTIHIPSRRTGKAHAQPITLGSGTRGRRAWIPFFKVRPRYDRPAPLRWVKADGPCSTVSKTAAEVGGSPGREAMKVGSIISSHNINVSSLASWKCSPQWIIQSPVRMATNVAQRNHYSHTHPLHVKTAQRSMNGNAQIIEAGRESAQ